MPSRCPTCEERNAADAARCRVCGYRLGPRASPFELPTELPGGIRVDAFGPGPATYRDRARGELRLRYRWELLSGSLLTAAIGLVVVGGSFIWSVDAIRGDTASIVRAVVLGAALLAIAYAATAKLVNHTRIELRSARLRLTHGPLPWPGSVDLPIDEIRALFCDAYRPSGGAPTAVRLHAILRSGEHRLLLGGIALGEEAQLIEDMLAVQLALPDARAAERTP